MGGKIDKKWAAVKAWDSAGYWRCTGALTENKWGYEALVDCCPSLTVSPKQRKVTTKPI
jgi:hypothetical protein